MMSTDMWPTLTALPTRSLARSVAAMRIESLTATLTGMGRNTSCLKTMARNQQLLETSSHAAAVVAQFQQDKHEGQIIPGQIRTCRQFRLARVSISAQTS